MIEILTIFIFLFAIFCALFASLFYRPKFSAGEEYDESEEHSGIIDVRREREEKARQKFEEESS